MITRTFNHSLSASAPQRPALLLRNAITAGSEVRIPETLVKTTGSELPDPRVNGKRRGYTSPAFRVLRRVWQGLTTGGNWPASLASQRRDTPLRPTRPPASPVPRKSRSLQPTPAVGLSARLSPPGRSRPPRLPPPGQANPALPPPGGPPPQRAGRSPGRSSPPPLRHFALCTLHFAFPPPAARPLRHPRPLPQTARGLIRRFRQLRRSDVIH